jgi:WD40 repeat protein
VSLWDPATGALTARFEEHADEVRSVAFSRDGRLVASGGLDGLIKVWSVAAEPAAPAREEPVSSPSGIFRRQPPTAPADMLHFHCACGAALKTGKQNAGKRTKCPHCGVPLTVPGE